MDSIKKVLVTGSNGYIGSLLMPLLDEAGYQVTGLDTGYFNDPVCFFKPEKKSPANFINKDVRNITIDDLKGIDAVCHLAALSNDPMGALNPELTFEINLRASEKLAELAKSAGVKRFLFSSSCSVYGAMGNQEITEDAPVDPKTAYAISKIEFEKSLLKLADENFCPIILRNSTAYGSSPKLRLDLVLNNLSASAFSSGEIKILSDGSPWRPVVHAEDIARLFVALLEAPKERVFKQIVNCGQNEENFQIRDIANVVKETFGNVSISYSATPDKDSRTYKVSFNKLAKLLPDFQFKWTLKKAAAELYSDFQKIGLPKNILTERNFIRMIQMRHLISSGKVDEKLFWSISPKSSKDAD